MLSQNTNTNTTSQENDKHLGSASKKLKREEKTSSETTLQQAAQAKGITIPSCGTMLTFKHPHPPINLLKHIEDDGTKLALDIKKCETYIAIYRDNPADGLSADKISIQHLPMLIEFLRLNQKIEHGDLPGQMLRVSDWSDDKLKSKEQVKSLYKQFIYHFLSLNLDINYINWACGKDNDEEAECLASSPKLKKLSMCGNDQGDAAAKVLATSNSLTDLDLSNNCITTVGAIALAASQTLQDLNLDDNEIDDDGIMAFAYSSSLRRLHLGSNSFGDVGASVLFKNNNLEYLDIGGSNVTDDSVCALAQHPRLITLCLTSTKVTNKTALAFFLADNTSLQNLCLNDTYIDDIGAKYLAKTYNKNLTAVALAYTKITAVGARALLANPNFSEIDLDGCDIPFAVLQEQLLKNTQLTSISIAPPDHLKHEKQAREDLVKYVIRRNQTLLLNTQLMTLLLICQRANRENAIRDSSLDLIPEIMCFLTGGKHSRHQNTISKSAQKVIIPQGINIPPCGTILKFPTDPLQPTLDLLKHIENGNKLALNLGNCETYQTNYKMDDKHPLGTCGRIEIVHLPMLIEFLKLNPQIEHGDFNHQQIRIPTEDDDKYKYDESYSVEAEEWYKEFITHFLSLNLDDNAIDFDYCRLDVECLAKSPKLKVLSINNNQLGDNGAITLAASKSLNRISLFNNKITDIGVKALADMPNLEFLEIGGNNVTDIGARAFAKHPKLITLSLAFTRITDNTAIAFSAVSNSPLRHLNLAGTAITATGVKALLKNSNLSTINLDGCNIPFAILKECLTKNITLTSISIAPPKNLAHEKQQREDLARSIMERNKKSAASTLTFFQAAQSSSSSSSSAVTSVNSASSSSNSVKQS